MSSEAAIHAALADALVVGELEPAITLLAEEIGARCGGFYRVPRPTFGEAATALASLVPPAVEELRHLTRDGVAAPFVRDDQCYIIAPLSPSPYGQRHAAGLVTLLHDSERSKGAIARITKLLPAFIAAYRRVRRFEELVGYSSALMALIESRIGACAVLAGADGEIIWMSQSARNALGETGRSALEAKLRSVTVSDGPKFRLDDLGAHRLFGEVSFVRESPHTSVHYLAVELHGTGVDTDAARFTLTRAEREVHEMLLQGNLYSEIAEKRFVSVETVRTHVKALFKKLRVSSRRELLDLGKRTPR